MAATRIQLRRGTSAEWAAANPVLASGESGVDVTTHQLRSGDGVTRWSALPRQGDNRLVYVADYGPLGTADDAATINAALAAGSGKVVVFPPNATLNTTALTLPDAVNTVVDGNGTTLKLVPTGVRYIGFRLTGTCTNVEVRNLRVQGSGAVADEHLGIGASGANLTNIRIVGCHVSDVVVGITFAADGSGFLSGVLYLGNYVQNVIGVAAGFGYGLHMSVSSTTEPADVRMIGNTIRSAQRHSIYVGKGRGISVIGNTILNHRDGQTAAPDILPAITVARSSDVLVTGNIVLNSAGGALLVGGTALTGSFAENIVVTANTFRESTSAAALVYIGQQAPATEGFPTGVIFTNNLLTHTTSAKGCMTVFNGKELRIAGNVFRVTVATSITALALQGIGSTGNTYMDDVIVEDNLFDVAGAGSALIRFSPGFETQTPRLWFRGNRKTGAAVGSMFALSAAATNPNVDVQDQDRGGLSFTAGITTKAGALGGPTATTAPVAGGAAALPATPLGYLTLNVNGTDRKIAYYG